MKSKKTIVVPNLQNKTVLAIDTLSRVYQLFHALPEMSSPKGVPVSVVYGLTRDVLDIMNKKKPDYLLFAMDAAGPTFRHEQFEDYKANRAEMPADLVIQIPLIRQLLEVMGIPCVELAGYEADDVLATVATQAVALGGECIIATADKDARQLIGEHVRLLNLRNNVIIGKQELIDDWGLRPDQVVDYLSLVGDAVDNVPGVPGIGPKTASDLLQKYETLENLFSHIDEVSGKKRKENLATHEETAKAGQELIRLETAVPIEIPWEDAKLHQPDTERLISFLQDMGFKSLVQKVAGGKNTRGLKKKKQSTVSDQKKQALFDLDEARESHSAATIARETVICVDSAMEEIQADKEVRAFVDSFSRESALTICFVVAESQRSSTPPSGVVLMSEERRVYVSGEVLGNSSLLKKIFSDQQCSKIVYDLKRQAVAAGLLGVELKGVVFDALIASYLLEAGERTMGPADIARRNGITINASPEGLPFDPKSLECTTERHAAGTVCQIVQQLYGPLVQGLGEASVTKLFETVELPLASLLGAMEARGILVDTKSLAKLSRVYTKKLESLKKEIYELAGREILVTSPVQVREVLFEDLGLPVVKRTKTGPSTDAEVLEELASLHPLPEKLLEHRKFSKLKSTYVDALPALVDSTTGHIHTSFNQTVTATGRLSSSEPNLQNIPTRSSEGQQIRTAFLPRRPRHVFVSADYSQIELRILAHLSGDAAMREAFASGEDIHTRTASAVYGVTDKEVTADMRRASKAVNFGILYGQSAFGLGKALGIPPSEAADFILAYFQTFAGAEAFMDDVLDRCQRDRFVTTILGRRRYISGVRDRDSRRASTTGCFALSLPERTAVNTVVQGSAADLIKLAMLRVDQRLRNELPEAEIVLQIHDELLLEGPADQVGGLSQLVTEEMQQAMQLEVPLEVTIQSGANWAECEKG